MSGHIAVIPARAGSVGLPGKNRLFFDATADFIQSQDWFARVVVSTDDPAVGEKARARNFEVRDRPVDLAGPAVPIKAVFVDLVGPMKIAAADILWLFYLPVLYKNPVDFVRARDLAERAGVRSVMSFIPAATHPYTCWRWDESEGRLSQYVANDVFRRQDMPPAWMAYHYTCCFRTDELPNLNSELVGPATRPIFLDSATAANLIEVDTPEDLARWRKAQIGKNR